MNRSERRKKLQDIQQKQDEANFQSSLNRARSITVGTCFGGTTEIMMRGNDGSVLWCPMQPVEIIELIHQLAANVGCHIMVKPRKDFSSWRNWITTDEEKLALNGFPPFVNDMAPFMQVGSNMPPPQELPGTYPPIPNKEKENASLAAEENINEHAPERTPKITG